MAGKHSPSPSAPYAEEFVSNGLTAEERELLEHYRSAREKRNNSKQKIWLMAGAGAVILILASGTAFAVGQLQPHQDSTPSVAGNTPTVVTTSGATHPDVSNLPDDGKKFVQDFGSKFIDPVSTFYANKALWADGDNSYGVGPDGAVIDPAGVADYKFTNIVDDPSPLQFQAPMGQLNLKQAGVSQDLIKYEYEHGFQYNLTLYMNYLAKNPMPAERAIINAEFIKNFSSANDAPTKRLMTTLAQLVDHYGSTSNFKLAGFTRDSMDNTKTSFWNNSMPATQSVTIDAAQNVLAYSCNLNVVIDISTFDGSKTASTKESLPDFDMWVETAPKAPIVTGPNHPNDPNGVRISYGQR